MHVDGYVSLSTNESMQTTIPHPLCHAYPSLTVTKLSPFVTLPDTHRNAQFSHSAAS